MFQNIPSVNVDSLIIDKVIDSQLEELEEVSN
jgi:hypothetical protein